MTPYQFFGKRSLFVGIESQHWTREQIISAAQRAKALGYDTLVLKVADGGIRWYNNVQELSVLHTEVNDIGAGLAFYQYCYGPLFGANQIKAEAEIANEIGSVSDYPILDMEIEWNNEISSAEFFMSELKGAHKFVISTWADPVQQQWMGVVDALWNSGKVAEFWPQEYSKFLEYTGGREFPEPLERSAIIPTYAAGWDAVPPYFIYDRVSLWEYSQPPQLLAQWARVPLRNAPTTALIAPTLASIAAQRQISIPALRAAHSDALARLAAQRSVAQIGDLDPLPENML